MDHLPDRPALVLAYADRLHMDELGALGLAFRTAPTLRDSLIRAERYFRRVTDTVRYRLDESGTLAVFARNLIRLGGDTLSFEDVCFSHGCETDPDHYASGLGCPVRFSAEEDGIVVRPDMLDLTKRLGDPAVAALMTTHLDDQIEAMAIEASFADTLLHRLSTGLSTGARSAAEIARDLGISERTFYRRLSEEGQTYQGLLQTAQHSLARDLLARSNCSIAEIAFLTGFSGQSTFSRASKLSVFGDSIRLVTGNTSDPATLRLAGLLFIAIILCRNGAEVLFRGPLVDFGDPSATASGIRNAIGTFRLAIAADIVMAAADAAPAILLYVIFRPVAQVLALAAMVFRLIQSVMVAMNLLHMQSALILTTGARDPVTEALGVVPPPCRAYPAGGGHGNLA